MAEADRIHQSALKTREKRRINNLKILRFDEDDNKLVKSTKVHVDSFVTALQLKDMVTDDQILNTLQQAHIASDGHYGISQAAQWNTTFEFPKEAIAADAALLDSCFGDFTLMCRIKQSRLAHNRISIQRVIDTFGQFGTKVPGMLPSDFQLLSDFAVHGITPPIGADFFPEATNLPPPLFKLWGDGIMALLDTTKAKAIPGIHFSAQHQADSKGKAEGRVIGDLSGQHDPAYTPLNGTSDSRDTLRCTIARLWGEIKHPTVVQLVLMVLTASDTHGCDALILWKKDLKGAFNLLNYNPAYCKLFAFPLTDDITVVHLAGLFGWIGMPHVFIIIGLCLRYVDDLMAVSPISSYQSDSTAVDTSVQHLLGQGSIAKQKSNAQDDWNF